MNIVSSATYDKIDSYYCKYQLYQHFNWLHKSLLNNIQEDSCILPDHTLQIVKGFKEYVAFKQIIRRRTKVIPVEYTLLHSFCHFVLQLGKALECLSSERQAFILDTFKRYNDIHNFRARYFEIIVLSAICGEDGLGFTMDRLPERNEETE